MINHSIHTGAKLHIRRQPANLAVLFLLWMVTLLFSCKPADKERSNPISRRTMVEIMVDIHIQEARADALHIPRDSLIPEMKITYLEILNKHNVKEADFKKTMDYYLQNPQQLDLMYQDVVDELSRREALGTGKPLEKDKNKDGK